MSNFNRKLRRSIARAQGLPSGFYCATMQNRMRKVDRQIRKLNKLIEERQDEDLQAEALLNTLTGINNSASSEERIPDGEESNSDLR